MKKISILCIAVALMFISAIGLQAKISYQVYSPGKKAKTTKSVALVKVKTSTAKKAYINGRRVPIKRGVIFQKVPVKIGENKIRLTLKTADDTTEEIFIVNRIEGSAKTSAKTKTKKPTVKKAQTEDSLKKEIIAKIIPQLKEEIISEVDYKINKEGQKSRNFTRNLVNRQIEQTMDMSGDTDALEITGVIETDVRSRINYDKDNFVNNNSLELKIKAAFNPHVIGRSSIEFNSLGLNSVSSPGDTFEHNNVQNQEIRINELYVDLYGFGSENIDLGVGKQRVAWGKADKLNQTDNLNPDDFSDIVDFGKKLPTNLFKMNYYDEAYTLSAVFIPVLTPAIMPATDETAVATAKLAQNNLPNVGTVGFSTDLPDRTFADSMIGLKLSTLLFGYDTSFSYFSGYDDIALLKKTTVVYPITPTNSPGTATLEYVHPRINVLGFDMAGSIGDVGVWAEVGFYTPESIDLATDVYYGGTTLVATPSSEFEPYTKYTIGMDYSFEWGLYVNAQLTRGFFDQSGEDLSSLLLVNLEQSAFEDKAEFALILGSESDGENIGGFVAPSITIFPAEATEISAGLFYADGEEDSISVMRRFKDAGFNQTIVKCKYNF